MAGLAIEDQAKLNIRPAINRQISLHSVKVQYTGSKLLSTLTFYVRNFFGHVSSGRGWSAGGGFLEPFSCERMSKFHCYFSRLGHDQDDRTNIL